MPRIFVSGRADVVPGRRQGQWIEVDDADQIRRRIATLLPVPSPDGGSEPGPADPQAWFVQAYDGLPDFGPHPSVDELLAYLDAVGEYGEPFEKLWASRRSDSVLQVANTFADTYQGTYADAATWAHHYLELIGELPRAQGDFDAYGRAAASRGEVVFVDANEGGIHVFWSE